MNKSCVVCKTGFIEKYRGWYDQYVPWACSSKCFKAMLANCYYGNEGFLDIRHSPAVTEFKHRSPDFRSNYEREFSEWLRKEKIPHKYEPYIITLGDKSRYVPDFWVYESVFVEVKGIWTSEGKKKYQSVIKEFYGLPIVVVDRAFLNMIKRTSK